MKNLLEELWYSRFCENFKENNDERRALLALIIKNEDRLKENLSKKEVDTLEALKDCIYQLNDLYQKEAFIKGVRFATSFMCEAMNINL